MIASHVSRASAIAQLLGGIALLFAADVILPVVIPGYPAAGAWLGQLLGAGWIAMAALNWLSRSVLLGGIYGRQQVLSNAALYFISTMVLLEAATRSGAPGILWALLVVNGTFTALYGWLLFRGPFERDIQLRRQSA